ncbi:MAG: hypothetical protein C4B59_12910 [Candidatus Methanogaster sp.]|uniref:Uncharacterized protein n=1 Tax=Candidatus Methanogaster sp. TaxID=3386292 RepID=A0AC61L0G1_9EURY|nr:MAG: hypothetical protein C4B59_12910 [ANME-2 cluster archaeon]
MINATVEDCVFKNSISCGVNFYVGAVNCTINNNILEDCGNSGIRIADTTSYSNKVTNNTINGGAGNIVINVGAHDNYVGYNSIHYTHPHGGIDLHTNVHNNTVEYNTLHDIGIGIYGSHAIYIHNEGSSNNTVRHNTMWDIDSNAIDVTMAHNNTILNNTVGANCGPLVVNSGHGNIFKDCDVHSSVDGVVGSFSWGWDTYDNVFINNNILKYEYNTVQTGSNTIRNPATKAFTVQLKDAGDVVNIEFIDWNTFTLNEDAGGHTSAKLTETGTYTITVESDTPLVTNFHNEPPTQQTVTLFWNCSVSDVDYYTIYQNGMIIATTKDQYYTVTNLLPDTTYTFSTSATVARVTDENATLRVQTAADDFGSNTVSIADDVTASRGNHVTAPIMIHNARGVACAGMKLTYDPGVVAVTGVTEGDFTSYFGFDDEHAAEGWVMINTYINETQLTGNAKVADVTFTAAGEVGATSTLDMEIISMADQNGYAVPNIVSNGLFTVVSDTSPPVVTCPSASQLIPDDTDGVPSWGETTTLSVAVTDESDVASVTIDLSAIGGSPVQPMIPTWDNVWSVTTSASAGTLPHTYKLQVSATDIYGYTNMSESVELVVMQNGDVTGDNDVSFDDIILLRTYATYLGQYTISNESVADVTGDSVVNIADAMLLENHIKRSDQYTLR